MKIKHGTRLETSFEGKLSIILVKDIGLELLNGEQRPYVEFCTIYNDTLKEHTVDFDSFQKTVEKYGYTRMLNS